MSVFDRIAPVYGLFFGYQKRRYALELERLASVVDLSGCRSVLDVGCGTGALCAALSLRGLRTTGVEPSLPMLAVARRKAGAAGISYLRASALEPLPFGDGAFDIVVASFVAHGMKEADRRLLYREMARLATRWVLLFDYGRKRSPVTDVLERLEGGDYFGFLRGVPAELEAHFPSVRVLGGDGRSAWYVCRPR